MAEIRADSVVHSVGTAAVTSEYFYVTYDAEGPQASPGVVRRRKLEGMGVRPPSALRGLCPMWNELCNVGVPGRPVWRVRQSTREITFTV